ncbi:MAG: 3-phosphoshikimate 1-carboxyvinyltransferase [Bacteroidales bacterium]|nr:3-phosphoshikimate 1-carboxyvinyltransferase [Bacteroidales bacterium]
MICTSIQNQGYGQILDTLDHPFVEMAEIRLDRCALSLKEIEDLFAETDTPLIATCRAAEMKGADPWEKAFRRLEAAIRGGARFADLELDAPVEISKRFRALCEECGTEIIRSWHDFSGTPDLEMLRQIVARCYRYGADIAKVVSTCRNQADAATLQALYEGQEPGRLVAFGMGDAGRQTRLDCLRLGAPFSYAALSDEQAAAPGQWNVEEMHRALYEPEGRPAVKCFMRNDLTVCASKSFAQRAIVAAALADGRSHLHGYSPCADSEAAIAVAKALGAKVHRSGSTLTIDGTGGAPLALKELHTGESGLLTRLMIPLLAALNRGPAVVTGEKTLLERPLKGAADIMAAFGVMLREEKVPIRVEGPLYPGRADISGKGGSQLISGLLMALPLCDKPSTLYVSEPKSIPYMFITTDVLRRFGVNIKAEMEGSDALVERQDWSACTEISFKIRGGQRYRSAEFEIEGDWSGAAAFLVAGAVFGKAEVAGLDTSSLQADLSIADILVDAGAVVSELDEKVCVRKAPLEAFEADLNNAPDLFPAVALLAAFCCGTSTLHGTGRLSGKESDRASALLQMLTQMGVPARIEGDELYIEGESLSSRILNGRLLKGGAYTTHHDHRMAMVLKIASLGMDAPVTLDDADCVTKSFPGFFEQFD